MGGAFYGKIFSLIIVSMKDVIYYKKLIMIGPLL